MTETPIPATILHDNGYPRVLDRVGCLFGQQTRTNITRLETEFEEKFKAIEKKIDRMTWALVATAISLSVSAIFLAINIALP